MATNIGICNGANLSQQLNLAPQLLNWLKILQASTLDLTQMVQSELASNPALETAPPEDDGEVAEDWTAEGAALESAEMYLDVSDVGTRLSVLADIDDEWRGADEPPLASSQVLQEKHDFLMDHLEKTPSLHDELEQAILVSGMGERAIHVARILAGSIDARGYLDADLAEIARSAGVDPAFAETVLHRFQTLVPAGIGARNLRECLVLQLRGLDADTRLAQVLVEQWLENLAMNQHAALAEHLGVAQSDLTEAFELIRTLDPEPGRNYQARAVEYVEADLEISCRNGALHAVLLDEHLPRLQLSSYCKRLLEARSGSKEDLDYIRGKVREASFLIQGITQRQETMLKVAREIMRAQHDFLACPDGCLQPLTMNKVAAMIGVHETTVSRAIANKYVRTERGLIEMRTFFKVGYRCADGSSVAPERVREMVAEMIGAENAMDSLIDSQISERFRKMGLKVARRTVAKYREELNIPSSKDRIAAARRRQDYRMAAAM